MIRVAMTLNAATKMMVAMTKVSAIFCTSSAVNRLRLSSDQSRE